jgi:hypothetical protein
VGGARLAHHRLAAEHLAIEIGGNHPPAVGQHDPADARHGEHKRGRSPHASGPRDQSGAVAQPPLSVEREDPRPDLTFVPRKFFGGQLVHRR